MGSGQAGIYRNPLCFTPGEGSLFCCPGRAPFLLEKIGLHGDSHASRPKTLWGRGQKKTRGLKYFGNLHMPSRKRHSLRPRQREKNTPSNKSGVEREPCTLFSTIVWFSWLYLPSPGTTCSSTYKIHHIPIVFPPGRNHYFLYKRTLRRKSIQRKKCFILKKRSPRG